MRWIFSKQPSVATGPVVIVLGMHRSGTSCLAGSLEAAGLHLGDVNTAALFNKKGNREHLDISALNDRILANTGHSWRNPPPTAATWTRNDRRDRDNLIASLSKSAPWGFKDPRTLLTFDGWLEALPEAKLVATFRHPLRVAKSLASRPEPLTVPIADGIGLWYLYNQRLIDIVDRFNVTLVNFDVAPDAYRASVKRVCQDLELTLPEQNEFFDQSLRTLGPAEDQRLDDKVQSLYDALIARALPAV